MFIALYIKKIGGHADYEIKEKKKHTEIPADKKTTFLGI